MQVHRLHETTEKELNELSKTHYRYYAMCLNCSKSETWLIERGTKAIDALLKMPCPTCSCTTLVKILGSLLVALTLALSTLTTTRAYAGTVELDFTGLPHELGGEFELEGVRFHHFTNTLNEEFTLVDLEYPPYREIRSDSQMIGVDFLADTSCVTVDIGSSGGRMYYVIVELTGWTSYPVLMVRGDSDIVLEYPGSTIETLTLYDRDIASTRWNPPPALAPTIRGLSYVVDVGSIPEPCALWLCAACAYAWSAVGARKNNFR